MSLQSDFVGVVLPAARIASERTGVPVSVILAQWALETGWGRSKAFLEGHNYGNQMRQLGGGEKEPIVYSDPAAGIAAYIGTLNDPRYAAVRSAPDPIAAAEELGRSKWDEDHYVGAALPVSLLPMPGGRVIELMFQNNLVGLDTEAQQAATRARLPEGGFNPIRDVASAVSGIRGNVREGLGGAPGAALGAAKDAYNWAAPSLGLPEIPEGDEIASGARRIALTAVFVAGGVGLVVMGAWRSVDASTRESIKSAGKMAATRGMVK